MQSQRWIDPIKTVEAIRSESPVTNLIIVGKKFDPGDRTVRIRCRCLQSDHRRCDEDCIVGWGGQGDNRKLIPNNLRNSDETQVEPNIRAIAEILVDFDGESILSLLKNARRQQRREGGAAIVVGGGRSKGSVRDRATWHVVAPYFGAVQGKNRAVVTLPILQDRHENGGGGCR